MTDPVGDLLTRIRNGQSARLDSVTAPASRLRSNVLDVLQREGYIRGWFEEELRPGVKELRIELKYDNGRRSSRRSSASPPRAAASTPRSASCRATSTGSASRSCPRRAASCPTPRRAPPMSAAKSSARCSDHVARRQKPGSPSPPGSPSSSRASISRPRASGASCSSMVHDDVVGRQGRRQARLQAAHREPPRPHAVGHGAQPREQRGSRRVGRLHRQPRDQRRRLPRPGRCQDAEAAARLQPRRRGSDPGRHPDQGA